MHTHPTMRSGLHPFQPSGDLAAVVLFSSFIACQAKLWLWRLWGSWLLKCCLFSFRHWDPCQPILNKNSIVQAGGAKLSLIGPEEVVCFLPWLRKQSGSYILTIIKSGSNNSIESFLMVSKAKIPNLPSTGMLLHCPQCHWLTMFLPPDKFYVLDWVCLIRPLGARWHCACLLEPQLQVVAAISPQHQLKKYNPATAKICPK